MTSCDVAIVGGGIVGTTLACALVERGLHVTLVEKERFSPLRPASDDYDLRVSAITLASRTLFQNLAAWDAMVSQRVHPIESMRIWEADETLCFDAADIGEACLAYIIENRVMQSALGARAEALGVDVRVPAVVESLHLGEDSATLTLANGENISARLVVGADGAQSRVRALAGIESQDHDYGQKAIVATVTTALPNRATAFQRFLPTGPLAFLPLDAHRSSIVWSVEHQHADELLALDTPSFIAQLHAAFGNALGAIVDVSGRAAFPLRATHAEHYVQPRLAIIGDAAHRIHPLAGQGLNLGLADAAALAEVIADARTARKDVGALHVLRRYERWRKGSNQLMLSVMNGFDFVFRTQGLLQPLRRRGLGAVNRLGPVKNLIMRQASGLAGDLPRLMKPRLAG